LVFEIFSHVPKTSQGLSRDVTVPEKTQIQRRPFCEKASTKFYIL